MKKKIALFCFILTLITVIAGCSTPTRHLKRMHPPGQVPTRLNCDPRSPYCS